MVALCFLQQVRLGEKRCGGPGTYSGPPPQPTLPQVRRAIVKALSATTVQCPCCHTLIPYYPRL